MRLRFWLKTGLQTSGIVIGGTVLYGSMMFIQSSYTTWQDVLMVIPVFFLLFGGMMMTAMLIGVYKLGLPLVLSFGSTRNEVLLGLQVARLLPIVLTTALLVLLTALSGENAFLPLWAVVPTALGIYLAFAALGSILGVVITRYGKFAGVATAVFIILCGFGGGFATAFASETSLLETITQRNGLPWLALGIGLMLYSISMIPEQRTVWKCNVKL